MGNMIDLEKETERVILVGVSVTDEDDTQKSLEELKGSGFHSRSGYCGRGDSKPGAGPSGHLCRQGKD